MNYLKANHTEEYATHYFFILDKIDKIAISCHTDKKSSLVKLLNKMLKYAN